MELFVDVNKRLTKDEIKSLDRTLKAKQAAIATVGTGTILLSTFASQAGDSKGVNTNVTVESTVKPNMEEQVLKVSPAKTKVASEVVYSDLIKFGVELKNENGENQVATLTKDKLDKMKNSQNRAVDGENVSVVYTAGVQEKNGKTTLNPFVTYEMTSKDMVYAPDSGRIFEKDSEQVVIEHNKGGMLYYSIIKGVNSNKKVNDKVEKSEILGETSDKTVKVAVSMKYSKGEFSNYVHPNELVDIEKSDSFRYGSAKYHAMPEVKVADNAKGTEVEKIIKRIPDEIKKSKIIRGVQIENKEQASLLNSELIFYSEEVLPLEVLEDGKANVSQEVRDLEPLVRAAAAKYHVESLTEFLLALLQQESGGNKEVLATDPFQSSQSKGGKIGSIQSQKESIDQGVKYFVSALTANGMFDPINHADARLAIQSYNFGTGLAREAKADGVNYSVKYVQEKAKQFRADAEARGIELAELKNEWRGEAAYGDFTYVAKIFNYFEPSESWKDKAAQVESEARAQTEKEELEKAEKQKTTTQQVVKTQQVEETSSVPTKEEVIAEAKEEFKDKINSINSDYQQPIIEEIPASDSLSGKVIVLDAGHGNKDVGAVGVDGQTTEADINLEITLKAKKAFENQGATVLLTRSTKDGFMEPVERGQFATEKKANLFISFHNNAAAYKTGLASGTETLYEAGDIDSQRLAEAVHGYMKQALPGIQDRKTKARSDLGVFNANRQTAILLESGFVTHPYDLSLITNQNVQMSIVNGLVKGVVDYLGVTQQVENIKENEVKQETETVTEDNSKPTDSVETTKPEAPVSNQIVEQKKDTVEEVEVKEDVDNKKSEDNTDNSEKSTDESFLFDLFNIGKDNKEDNKSDNPEEEKTPSKKEEKNETKKVSMKKSNDDLFIWDFIGKRA